MVLTATALLGAATATTIDIKSLIIGALIGALIGAIISIIFQEPIKRYLDLRKDRAKRSTDIAVDSIKSCYAPIMGLFDELVAGPSTKQEAQEKMLSIYRQYRNSLLDQNDEGPIWVAMCQFADTEDFSRAREQFRGYYQEKRKRAGMSES